MSAPFLKFPHTHHLFDLGTCLSRADKILTAEGAKLFFSRPVVLEEKIDGANLGFSLSPDGTVLVQNRGNYINAQNHPQFRLLDTWISKHEDSLFNILINNCILFGEWCYALHSIAYNRLPDWFLGFDIYDRKLGRFLSRKKRHEILKETGLAEVPFLGEKMITKTELGQMLYRKSAFYDGPVEGIYLRIDSEDGYLLHRAKAVRPGFTQAIDSHWSRRKLTPNRLESASD